MFLILLSIIICQADQIESDSCSEGLFLNNSVCAQCTSNCQRCNQLDTCDLCTPGFYIRNKNVLSVLWVVRTVFHLKNVYHVQKNTSCQMVGVLIVPQFVMIVPSQEFVKFVNLDIMPQATTDAIHAEPTAVCAQMRQTANHAYTDITFKPLTASNVQKDATASNAVETMGSVATAVLLDFIHSFAIFHVPKGVETKHVIKITGSAQLGVMKVVMVHHVSHALNCV